MCKELLEAFFPSAPPIHKLHPHDEQQRTINQPQSSITIEELDVIVRKLPNRKAPGPDSINGTIFKNYFAIRGNIFRTLIEKCINIGLFPACWKEGKVVPVPKGNREKTYKYYRPITLLSVPGKCLEKIFIDRVLQQIKNNGVWQEQQYGFTPNKSTTHALVDLTTFLIQIRKEKKHTIAISLDITGAFDNISHRKIIELMTEYGVDDNLIAFTRSYLTDRNATLQVGDAKGSKRIVRGCAQGSKCGPGLFLIAMNELLTILQKENIKTFAYADDLLLTFSGQDIDLLAAQATTILRLVSCWGHDSGLHFNPKKTQAIIIRCKKKTKWPVITMGSDILTESENLKYLGVYINKNLSWQPHIKQIKQKAQAAIGICRRAMGSSWGLPTYLRQRIYKCIIIPICTYAVPAWIDAFNIKKNQDQFRIIEHSTVRQDQESSK